MATASTLESSVYHPSHPQAFYICCALAMIIVPFLLMILLSAVKCHSVFPVDLALHLASASCKYKSGQCL